jgi:hypothetical protein
MTGWVAQNARDSRCAQHWNDVDHSLAAVVKLETVEPLAQHGVQPLDVALGRGNAPA